MKKSLYREIVRKDRRYGISKNPLDILLLEQVNSGLSAVEQQEKDEIENIIDHELTENFKIGGHVDYDYILNRISSEEDFNNLVNQKKDVKLCSLFIDLRNFTRRALFVNDPGVETIEEIAKLKQEAITTWIKIARYYQAHIHSITGDGLMVLIGGEQFEDTDEWTIGARGYLIALRVLESTDRFNDKLKQVLTEKGYEQFISSAGNLLDVKVGIEYSPNTLINAQGVIVNESGVKKAVGEIKATAFEIDFSAKLLGYYNDICRDKINSSPKYGRLLLFGEKYQELMAFKETVKVEKYTTYSKTMFGVSQSRNINYLDCSEYKHQIVTLDDVASICEVFDGSELAKATTINVGREAKVQHG